MRPHPVVRAAVIAAGLLAAAPAFASRDVMLVLDNSGSMRRNDPARLAGPAVLEFIANQPRDTRVGIVLFGTAAELALPLTPAEVAADGEAAGALKRFTYTSKWTQIAAGVERALYELRSEGRADAARAIVLMTDGWVDTGDKARDAELHTWLREDLTAQAKLDQVRIFGIAFTEQADFQLLQSLATGTDGEYFRVLSPEGIARTFKRLDSVVATVPARPEAAMPAPAAAAPVPQPAAAAPVAAPSLESPAETVPGFAWLAWLAGTLVLAAGGVFGWLYRGRLFAGDAGATAPQARGGPLGVLYDGAERHELGEKPVVIGRAGGNDPTRHYIVIPEKTVGRWHATIERRGQTFWLRDEGSVNGTFINGERIVGERPLKHRDSLRIHTHQFEFEIPELADADRTVMQQVRVN